MKHSWKGLCKVCDAEMKHSWKRLCKVCDTEMKHSWKRLCKVCDTEIKHSWKRLCKVCDADMKKKKLKRACEVCDADMKNTNKRGCEICDADVKQKTDKKTNKKRGCEVCDTDMRLNLNGPLGLQYFDVLLRLALLITVCLFFFVVLWKAQKCEQKVLKSAGLEKGVGVGVGVVGKRGGWGGISLWGGAHPVLSPAFELIVKVRGEGSERDCTLDADGGWKEGVSRLRGMFVLRFSVALPFVKCTCHIGKTCIRRCFKYCYLLPCAKLLSSSAICLFNVIKNVMSSTVPGMDQSWAILFLYVNTDETETIARQSMLIWQMCMGPVVFRTAPFAEAQGFSAWKVSFEDGHCASPVSVRNEQTVLLWRTVPKKIHW